MCVNSFFKYTHVTETAQIIMKVVRYQLFHFSIWFLIWLDKINNQNNDLYYYYYYYYYYTNQNVIKILYFLAVYLCFQFNKWLQKIPFFCMILELTTCVKRFKIRFENINTQHSHYVVATICYNIFGRMWGTTVRTWFIIISILTYFFFK